MRSNVIVPSPGPPGYDPKSGRPPPKRDTVPYRLTLRGVSSVRVPERVKLGEPDAHAELLKLGLTLGLRVMEPLPDGDREPDPEPVGLRVALAQREGLRVTVGDHV